VTKDKKKCLYSIRHTFGANVYGVSGDFKFAAEMLGHSLGKSVTNRYVKAMQVDDLRERADKMRVEGIDLNLLEQRAQELFFPV
jgi:integrase